VGMGIGQAVWNWLAVGGRIGKKGRVAWRGKRERERGIGFLFLQKTFKIIPLDSESYYMSYVPISFDWLTILILNVVTVLLVLAVITIPTLVVSRMKLIESLKFKS